MKRSFVLIVASALVLLTGVADSAAPYPVDAQKIVYLSDTGPVLIGLDVRIDGRPFRTAYRDFINGLFNYLDKDRDGVLSRAEMARAPLPASLGGGPDALFVRTLKVPAVPAKVGRDEKTTREGLAEHYRKNGFAPFSISFAPRQTAVVVLNNLRPEGPTSA